MLEDFVGYLPHSLRHIDRKSVAEMNLTGGIIGPDFPTNIAYHDLSGPSRHRIMELDDKNFAFAKNEFNEILVPFLPRALKYLRYHRGSHLSRSRSASAASLSMSAPPPLIAGSLRIMSTASTAPMNLLSTTPTASYVSCLDASVEVPRDQLLSPGSLGRLNY